MTQQTDSLTVNKLPLQHLTLEALILQDEDVPLSCAGSDQPHTLRPLSLYKEPTGSLAPMQPRNAQLTLV